MSRKTLLVFVILALLGASLASWSAPASPSKNKEESPRVEVLSNHPVLVLASDSGGHVLEEPRIRSIGGRSFVIGKATQKFQLTKESFPHKTIWIPLDKVTEMAELPPE